MRFSVTFDAADHLALADWWAETLGWERSYAADEMAMIGPAGATAPTGEHMLFMAVPEAKAAKNRVHLDLHPEGDTTAFLDGLVARGATLVSQQGEGWPVRWAVLTDPEATSSASCSKGANDMPEVSAHVPMTPGWIDIGTDVEAAKAFYTALFGWETADAGPPEEAGGYGFFLDKGRMVAGFGPQQNPGPPSWATYVVVPSADEIAGKVAGAGGQVVVPPMAVMDAGTMAVFTDAQGAFFSVWQPGQHTGAQVVREPGSFTWCELNTRDVAGSKAFYASVFGWGAETSGEGTPMPYTEFKVGGESIAGMAEMGDYLPADVPPHWLVYVEVADTDAAVAKVTSLGGSVVVPAMDFPGGRFSIVMDPQGASLGLMTPSPQG